jgi:hypothetical protein
MRHGRAAVLILAAATLAGCGGDGRPDEAAVRARRADVDRFLATFDQAERACIERVLPRKRLKEALIAALDRDATDQELPEAIFEITSCAEHAEVALALSRAMIGVFPERPLGPGLAQAKLPANGEGMAALFARFPPALGERHRPRGLQLTGPVRWSAAYRHRGGVERTQQVVVEDLNAGPRGQRVENGPTGGEMVGWLALQAGPRLARAGRDGEIVWARWTAGDGGDARHAAAWAAGPGEWLFQADAESGATLDSLIAAFAGAAHPR